MTATPFWKRQDTVYGAFSHSATHKRSRTRDKRRCPLDTTVLMRYLAYIAGARQYKCIRGRITCFKRWQVMHQVYWMADMSFLKPFLLAAKNLAPPCKTPREPLLSDHFSKIIEDFSDSSFNKCVKASLLASHRGLMQCREFTVKSHPKLTRRRTFAEMASQRFSWTGNSKLSSTRTLKTRSLEH